MEDILKQKIKDLAKAASKTPSFRGSITDDRMAAVKENAFMAGAIAMWELVYEHSLFPEYKLESNMRIVNQREGVYQYTPETTDESFKEAREEHKKINNQAPNAERSVAENPKPEKKTSASKRKKA